ncbi:MAG TPA: methyltransferase domain-containing protein [Anaeromyxobacteraceae bacterium]|nr:methyltransferase domain-containing protein [Anaeromyxobacteraceae bacterium]
MTAPRYLNQEALAPSPDTSWGKLLDLVPEGALVLDVGCGHGALAAALAARKRCRVIGIETNSEAAATARTRCDRVFVGTVEEVLEQPGVPMDFDVVVASDVLEHLLDPVRVLERLAQVLKPGGALVASVPNATHFSVIASLVQGRFPRSREGLLDSTHVQFFGEEDALALFEGAGYAARVVDRVTIDPRLSEFHTDLSSLPPALLEYIDQNPNGATYQFILRAVPQAWATPLDRRDCGVPAQTPAPVQHRLAAEVAEVRAELARYHAALVGKDLELAANEHRRGELEQYVSELRGESEPLRAQVASYHQALVELRTSAQSKEGEMKRLVQRVEQFCGEERGATSASLSAEEIEQELLVRSRRSPARERLGAARTFPELGRLRVLYVVDRDDAPFRYRCVHGCEQLRELGVSANVAHLHSPTLDQRIPSYSLVVLFRLPWSERVAALVHLAHESGAKVAFEVDDLVFDPSVEPLLPFLNRMGSATREEYQRTFRALGKTLQAADFCIGATEMIARHARALGKPALVHPNLLSRHYVDLSRVIHPMRSALQRRPAVGYMSGSNTHDGDLESIASALREVMQRRPELSLVLCGHLAPPASLRRLSSRVICVPYQDYRVYPWLMARCRALLAPLEAVNDFTNAKSALKVFEAGAFGIPAIASGTAPYRQAIEEGVSGFVARDERDWVEALLEVSDAARSAAMGDAARAIALEEYSPAAWKGVLARRLLERAGSATGAAPALASLEGETASIRGRLLEQARRARSSISLAFGNSGRTQGASSFTLDAADPLHDGLAAFGDGAKRQVSGKQAGVVLIGRGAPLSRLGHSASVLPEGSGTLRGPKFITTDRDPWFLLERFQWPEGGAEALVLRMRIRAAAAVARAQIYWEERNREGYREERSIRFDVFPDGEWHTYVVTKAGGSWPVRPRTLRFDPIDQPGTVELDFLAALAPGWEALIEAASPVPSPASPERPPVDAAQSPPVDIVIPVYNAREFTRRCIESVLTHATGDWRLVLINDASSEPGVSEDLAAFAAREPRIILLTNEKNSGFVVTANRGMRQASGRDVLLLNSDTEVFEGFLDRLRVAAYAILGTGILTPFSNNATICSIPDFARDNPIPEGYTPERFARLVSDCSLRRRPELVTGVGFCMYVKAEVLEKVGYLDEKTFGRGYGEENDLCWRAKKAGFTVRLCDDVFVFHKGRASFAQDGRLDEGHPNDKLLEMKQPGYHAAVAEFVRTNPLAPLQENVRFHMRRLADGRDGALLFLVHASPFSPAAGGTEHHVRDLVRTLRLPRAVIAWTEDGAIAVAEVLDGDTSAPAIYRFPARRPPQLCVEDRETRTVMRRILELFQVRAAHVHHVMSWPIRIGNTLREAGVPYVVTAHDYYCVCPSWNLFDPERLERCECTGDETPSEPGCVPAVLRLMGIHGVDAVQFRRDHRAAFSDLLRGAAAVIFPSQAALEIVRRRLTLGAVRTEVIEHGYDPVGLPIRAAPGPRLRVAVVGEVAFPIKGSAQYLELVRGTRDLPVDWHFFGTTDRFGFAEKLRTAAAPGRLRLHGRYERSEIVPKLAGAGIDLVVILPQWPETFSFVLSEAILAGCPVLVSDQGALAERTRSLGVGRVVANVGEALETLSAWSRDRDQLAPFQAAVAGSHHRRNADSARDHLNLYDGLGLLRSGPQSLVLDQAGYHEVAAALNHQSPRSANRPADESRSLGNGAVDRLRPLLKPFVPWQLRHLLMQGYRTVRGLR